MYELMTDRARRVFQLANQEAQRFNHEYIGTEHILLGLVRGGDCVAARVIGGFGIDLRKIRLEVEKLMRSGPDMVTMGKLPQTPLAKKVIEYSMEEARERSYVGTEHILLGLLRAGGMAAEVLTNLGLKLEEVREVALDLPGLKSRPSAFWTMPPEPQKEKAMLSELDHELATLVAHGASTEMDWRDLYREVRAEVLKLREQLASAPDWETAVESRLRQMSQGTFGGEVCMEIRSYDDGAVGYTLTTASMPNRPFLDVTAGSFEAALAKLFEAHDAAVKKCQTTPS